MELLYTPRIVGSLTMPYFKALQDIHLIAFEFWDKLRFRLSICNTCLLHDE